MKDGSVNTLNGKQGLNHGQLEILRSEFSKSQYIAGTTRCSDVAKKPGLSEQQVKQWFKMRRAAIAYSKRKEKKVRSGHDDDDAPDVKAEKVKKETKVR